MILNDEKAVRHDDAQLLCFLEQAALQVYAARPAEASEVVTVTLVPGAYQNVPGGASFVEVVGVTGDDEASGVASVLDTTMAQRYKRASCKRAASASASAGYVPGAAERASYSASAFKVSPPVPAGTTQTLQVVVTNRDKCPIVGDCVDLPKAYQAALTDYVVARAFSIQSESAYAGTKATEHMSMFLSSLNIQYNGQARVASGYNLGAEGTGSPTVGPQRDLNGVR